LALASPPAAFLQHHPPRSPAATNTSGLRRVTGARDCPVSPVVARTIRPEHLHARRSGIRNGLGECLSAVYPYRLFVPDGGLIAYGVDIVDIHRKTANYVDRILKGERAADLPAQTPSKSLGLSVPPTLLATADEVIE
jgi:hypothetical protein